MLRAGKFPVPDTRIVMETPRPSGRPLAGETMETLVHIGRFIQEWSRLGGRWSFVFRMDVSHLLTGLSTANDSMINQAIRDRFGGDQRPVRCRVCKGKGWVGRGRPVCEECHGHKFTRTAGPIHGVTSHAMAALGVAMWWSLRPKVQQWIINPGGRDPRKKDKSKSRTQKSRTSQILK